MELMRLLVSRVVKREGGGHDRLNLSDDGKQANNNGRRVNNLYAGAYRCWQSLGALDVDLRLYACWRTEAPGGPDYSWNRCAANRL